MAKNYPYRYRDFSYGAAQAALAARDQGKFAEMHRLLLDRSPKLDRESLVECAREIRLDVARFTRDLDSTANRAEIDGDVRLAEQLDIYSTPAFYINGIKLLGERPFESFRAVIDRELGRTAGHGRK